MQLTEQERKDLIRRQKAYEAAVRAHELIEEAWGLLDTVCSESHQGSGAYNVADKMADKMKILEDEALELMCDIKELKLYVINPEIAIQKIKSKELY